jgi:ribosomal protein L21E
VKLATAKEANMSEKIEAQEEVEVDALAEAQAKVAELTEKIGQLTGGGDELNDLIDMMQVFVYGLTPRQAEMFNTDAVMANAEVKFGHHQLITGLKVVKYEDDELDVVGFAGDSDRILWKNVTTQPRRTARRSFQGVVMDRKMKKAITRKVLEAYQTQDMVDITSVPAIVDGHWGHRQASRDAAQTQQRTGGYRGYQAGGFGVPVATAPVATAVPVGGGMDDVPF